MKDVESTEKRYKIYLFCIFNNILNSVWNTFIDDSDKNVQSSCTICKRNSFSSIILWKYKMYFWTVIVIVLCRIDIKHIKLVGFVMLTPWFKVCELVNKLTFLWNGFLITMSWKMLPRIFSVYLLRTQRNRWNSTM